MELPTIPTGLASTASIRNLGTVNGVNGPSETAKKFGSVLATLLVKEMRKSLSEGFFGEGADGDIYSGWLDEQVGQTLADRDSLHMTDLIERGVAQKSEASL